MKRRRYPKNESGEKGVKTFQQIAGTEIGRALLTRNMGYQYGTDRNIYSALGYPATRALTFESYYARYQRQDIAKAVIDKPVDYTWKGRLDIEEPQVEDDTQLTGAWRGLEEELGLKGIFSEVDKLTGIGRFGVLLLGLDDVKDIDGWREPAEDARRLLYVKPLAEGNVELKDWEKNPSDPRYGMPRLYSITVGTPGEQDTMQIDVHHSRVIHIADGLGSGVYGTPRLQSVYNRLMDLEKIVGGDAEMFWRGARPGYNYSLDPEYKMGDDEEETLQTRIQEYEHNLRRFIVSQGASINSLAQQVADPSNHVDVQIQMISSVKGIPKRILTGSERGELASSQDQGEWLSTIAARRDEFASRKIVRPFVNRCIELGILPPPQDEREGYTVRWEDLFAKSEKDKAEIGKTRADALKDYAGEAAAQAIMPPRAFYEMVMGFSPDEVDRIEELVGAQVREEENDFEDEEE